MQIVGAGIVARSQYSLPPFRLSRPASLDEAKRIMAEESEAPIPFAGGTDIFAAIREGLFIAHLVSLDRIESLRQIAVVNDELRIGALVTHEDGCVHPLVREHLPGLADAWQRIATVRIRMAATLGGNLMARRRRYEGSILMIGLDARLSFATPKGEVELTPSDVWEGNVPERAILTSVGIPLARRPRFSYDRSLRPIVTLGAALWDDAGGLTGRAVIATERLVPHILPLDLSGLDAKRLAADAGDVATRAFSALPDSFRDEMTGNAYLRKAGAAMLARRLRHLAEAGI